MELQVVSPSVGLRREAHPRALLETELLFGERFIGELAKPRWLCGYAELDGYSGYLPSVGVTDALVAPTHRVSALRTIAYEQPILEAPPNMPLSMNALCAVVEERNRYSRVHNAGWVFSEHLMPVHERALDWVAEAEKFLGVPYFWGGRDSIRGVDCSGLMQNAFLAAGISMPRNSGQQETTLGRKLSSTGPLRLSNLVRGDRVFWKGHVGVMVDEVRLLHATAERMLVVIEPLADVVKRRCERGSDVTSVRRL